MSRKASIKRSDNRFLNRAHNQSRAKRRWREKEARGVEMQAPLTGGYRIICSLRVAIMQNRGCNGTGTISHSWCLRIFYKQEAKFKGPVKRSGCRPQLLWHGGGLGAWRQRQGSANNQPHPGQGYLLFPKSPEGPDRL